jgi:hypothetical protein
MTIENDSLDYGTWVSDSELATIRRLGSITDPPPRRRWCPTHRRRENVSPDGVLRCGPAWQELYAMERQASLSQTSTVEGLAAIAEKLEGLARVVGAVIAEPPGPQPPMPPPPPPLPPLPPQPGRYGKGGIALP